MSYSLSLKLVLDDVQNLWVRIFHTQGSPQGNLFITFKKDITNMQLSADSEWIELTKTLETLV